MIVHTAHGAGAASGVFAVGSMLGAAVWRAVSVAATTASDSAKHAAAQQIVEQITHVALCAGERNAERPRDRRGDGGGFLPAQHGAPDQPSGFVEGIEMAVAGEQHQ